MKLRMPSILLFLFFAFWLNEALAQKLPDILQEVLRSDTAYQSISCKIDVQLNVPGLSMPDKEIELKLEKGKKPRIKGKGIIILPKHGILGQYREFLEVDCQAIPLRENEDTIVYKVVSLDHKTDWVTVDFALTKSLSKIHSMLISTRKDGEYLVRHEYASDSEFFPEQTEISFEAMPLKLPLKFMGKQEEMDLLIDDNNGSLTGNIMLRYSEISWEKAPD